MKRLTLASSLALGSMLLLSPGSAEAVPLSNTAVMHDDLCALFDCDNPVATTFDSFSFEMGGAPPDGDSAVTVLPGIPTTAADGLFLYNYDLNNHENSGVTLHGYTVAFRDLVSLDLNGDDVPDSSWYCTNCGSIAGSSGAGSVTPNAASYVEVAKSLSFSFFLNEIHAGELSADFGVVSSTPPFVSIANVLDTTPLTDAPDTLVPVPEPASVILLGLGCLGLGAWRRRA